MKKLDQVLDVKIGVVGAGSWGTALGNLLADKGYTVHIWAYEADVVHQILNERENKLFLPEIKLSQRLVPSGDLDRVVSGKDLLLVVVPSHVMRETARKFSSYVMKDALVELESLQGEVAALRRAQSEPIAVVGVGCRFPGGEKAS